MAKKKGKKAAAAVDPAKSQDLPNRDASMFKQVVKASENGSHKKCIKLCDMILKNWPNHGETLAFKGLSCAKLKRNEAGELLKKAIRCNMKSHVCWHCNGLVLKEQGDFAGALKSFQMALRFDPDSHIILQDISLLQVWKRDFPAFVETRRRLMVLRSQYKANWTMFAISRHLAGDLTGAIEVLDSYEDTAQVQPRDDVDVDYEYSELKMYRATIMQQQEKYDECLKLLEEKDQWLSDREAVRKMKAEIYIAKGEIEEAQKFLRQALEENCECEDHHMAYRESLNLKPSGTCIGVTAMVGGCGLTQLRRGESTSYATYDTATIEKLNTLYEEFQKKWPKSTASFRLPLDYLPGADDAFRHAIAAYMVPRLRRGIPSLFKDLRALYRDNVKRQVITEVIEMFLVNLRGDGGALRFFKDAGECKKWGQPAAYIEEAGEAPSCLMWTLYYAAQHCEYLHDGQRALDLVDECILHTPTNIDAYVLKARIYKHAGDYATAFKLMNQARCMDTADRFINTKCTRYAYRAGEVEEAQKIVALFLKENPEDSLIDMQVSWYALAAARSYLARGETGLGLKRLMRVDQYFTEFTKSQFQFVQYCGRMGYLRAYEAMVDWDGAMRNHRFMRAASETLVSTYIDMFDAAALHGDEYFETDPALQGLTNAERKNVLRQRRKEAFKLQQEAELKKVEEEKEKQRREQESENKGYQIPKYEDTDPEGEQLAKTVKPLEAAIPFIRQLQWYAPESLLTWILSARVFSRKGKPLLVLEALERAIKITTSTDDTATREVISTDPDTHFELCEFLYVHHSTTSELWLSYPPAVQEFLTCRLKAIRDSCTPAVSGDGDASGAIQSYNDRWLAYGTHKQRLSHALSAARVVAMVASYASLPPKPAQKAPLLLLSKADDADDDDKAAKTVTAAAAGGANEVVDPESLYRRPHQVTSDLIPADVIKRIGTMLMPDKETSVGLHRETVTFLRKLHTSTTATVKQMQEHVDSDVEKTFKSAALKLYPFTPEFGAPTPVLKALGQICEIKDGDGDNDGDDEGEGEGDAANADGEAK